MNCKQGDLAVVTKSENGNTGKVVRVLRASVGNSVAIGAEYAEVGQTWCRDKDSWLWVVESASGLRHANGDIDCTRPYPDFALRPIRDPGEDATDETLEWLPVPTPEHA